MARLLNKKGQSFRDIIFFIVFILFFGIAALSTTLISNNITTAFQANPVINASSSAMYALEKSNDINNKWDFLVLAVLFGFALSMVIIGYFIDTQSIFMVIYIIALIAGVPVVLVISYVWEKLIETSSFATIAATQFIITNHIFANLIIYYTIIAGIALTATYAKSRQY